MLEETSKHLLKVILHLKPHTLSLYMQNMLKGKQSMSKHLQGRSMTMSILHLRPLRLYQHMPQFNFLLHNGLVQCNLMLSRCLLTGLHLTLNNEFVLQQRYLQQKHGEVFKSSRQKEHKKQHLQGSSSETQKRPFTRSGTPKE